MGSAAKGTASGDICDEPTSALDPVGRKEILELLLAVREQTTVLFSTHILSDVERICTDVAFLDHGTADLQGALTDIKSSYRSDEYLVETEDEAGLLLLLEAFPAMKRNSKTVLSFSEKDLALHEAMRFVADRKIGLLKIERVEPTLESLFMEVVEK